jgi:hypothetical protein
MPSVGSILLGEVAAHMASVISPATSANAGERPTSRDFSVSMAPTCRSRRCCAYCRPTAHAEQPPASLSRVACICRGCRACSG